MTESPHDDTTPTTAVGAVTVWEPIFAARRDPLREVASAMTEQNCGALLVRTRGNRIGIVTERDIVHALAAGSAGSDWTTDAMTREALSVKADTPIGEVAALMLEANIRHMIVSDDVGDRVGIVSIRDLVKAWLPTTR